MTESRVKQVRAKDSGCQCSWVIWEHQYSELEQRILGVRLLVSQGRGRATAGSTFEKRASESQQNSC